MGAPSRHAPQIKQSFVGAAGDQRSPLPHPHTCRLCRGGLRPPAKPRRGPHPRRRRKKWGSDHNLSLFHRGSPLWTGPVLYGGVKPGRRKPIWSHLTRTGAPFSLDSKNRSFFSREKEMGFERLPRPFMYGDRHLLYKHDLPPSGGRCPAGADEGALDRTKKEIYFTDPPSSVICFANATFPLKGGR